MKTLKRVLTLTLALMLTLTLLAPAARAAESDTEAYITLSNEPVGYALVAADDREMVVKIVPDDTTVSISLPSGGEGSYMMIDLDNWEDDNGEVHWSIEGEGDGLWESVVNEPVASWRSTFVRYHVYKDHNSLKCLDRTGYIVLQSAVDSLIAEGAPITMLPADQAVSKTGFLVDA